MTYGDRLRYWAIARLIDNQWVIIARFRTRSDADGHLEFLQRTLPDAQFEIVFEVSDRDGI